MLVNEVITEFKFKGDTGPLADYGENLGDADDSTVKFIAITTAAVTAVNYFVTSMLAGVDAGAQFARTIDVSTESVQELGFAASVSGSSFGAMTSTLSNLSKKIGEASLKGSDDFARLGLSIRGANGELKKSDELFDDISRRFRGMDVAEQANYAESLGIDRSLLQLMRKTADETNNLRARARALGVVTEAQSKEVIKYNDSLTTLNFGMKAVAIHASIVLAPAMRESSEVFTDFLIANKELIKEGISKVIDIILSLMGMLGRLWKMIDGIIGATIGWKLAVIGLVIAFWPLSLTVTIIAAIALAIDDLMVGVTGGKSIVADFFQEFLNIDLISFFRAIGREIDEAMAILNQFGSWLGILIFDLTQIDLSALFSISDAADLIFESWDGVAEFFAGIWQSITDSMPDFSELVPDWMQNLLGGKSIIDIEPMQLAGAQFDQDFMPMQLPNSSSNTIQQDINIQVSSEGSAQAIASEMRHEIQIAGDQLGRSGGR